MEHVYENVDGDAEKISAFTFNPVLNRHASLHGIVTYNSSQSSFNTLVLAEYLFFSISMTKETFSDAAKIQS